MYNKS